jgi:hypothetical protein
MKPSSKWRFSFVACVAFLGILVDCAYAKMHPKVPAANNQHVCSAAVDAFEIPHIVYQGGDCRLHHDQLVRERRRLEIVDGISDCGWGNPIALSYGPGMPARRSLCRPGKHRSLHFS